MRLLPQKYKRQINMKIIFLLLIITSLPGCLSNNQTRGISNMTAGKNNKAEINLENYENDKQIEYDLVFDKSIAEQNGFSFKIMKKYFETLMLSKHLYSTEYKNDEFIIGMAELPDHLKHILITEINNDRSELVKIGNICRVENIRKWNDDYPDFFVMNARSPVTFISIESYPAELQLVVFKVKQINWMKTKGSQDDIYEHGKAKIQVVERIYSENNRIRQEDELWLSGYRLRDKNKYIIPKVPIENGLIFWPDSIVIFPDNKTLFIALLKRDDQNKLWEAVRLQHDLEDAYSGGKSLAGFRDKLRAVAEKSIRKRQIKKIQFR
jgi:hypothetical protein